MASAGSLGSHLSGSRINLTQVRDKARNELRDCLAQCPQNKWLVLDEDILSLLNLVVEFSFIKDLGVTKLLKLPCPVFDEAVRSAHYLVFLIKPNRNMVKQSIEAIRAAMRFNSKVQFAVYFVPSGTYEAREMVHKERLACIVSEYHLDMIPLDNDLISLQFNDSFKEVHVENDTGSLYHAAKSLMVLQGLFGIIPQIYGKGDAARLVVDMMKKKQQELYGRGQPEVVPQISTLVLIDRAVDLMTPLSTQLTYEGLIDEIYGIRNTSVKLPRGKFSDDILPKVPPGSTPPPEFSILLTSAEEMYADLRDLHINAVGAKLSERTKRITAAYEERHDVRTVSQIRQFVTKLPHMQTAKQSLSRHTAITELLRNITDQKRFIEGIYAEQALREEDSTERTNVYIDTAIGNREPVEKVLRLICLQSVSSNGLKPKLLDQYKRDVLMAYGYQYLTAMDKLEAAGLLRVQANRHFSVIKQNLRLYQEVDEKNPVDISYTFSGYAPLSVRLIDHVVRNNGWGILEEQLRYLPGPTFEEIQLLPKALSKKKPPTTERHQVVLVYFLGGCTYAEVSALRFLSQREESNTDYVVVTTNFTTGQLMIQSLIRDTHQFSPCGTLIEQFSVGPKARVLHE